MTLKKRIIKYVLITITVLIICYAVFSYLALRSWNESFAPPELKGGDYVAANNAGYNMFDANMQNIYILNRSSIDSRVIYMRFDTSEEIYEQFVQKVVKGFSAKNYSKNLDLPAGWPQNFDLFGNVRPEWWSPCSVGKTYNYYLQLSGRGEGVYSCYDTNLKQVYFWFWTAQYWTIASQPVSSPK